MTLSRKHPMKRSGRLKPVNRKRKASEFARCYHSKERVAWVRSQPCIVRMGGRVIPRLSCSSQIDNAHTEGGGAGRKAGYDTIVPMCRAHHRLVHDYGARQLEMLYGIDLQAEASRVAALWREQA